jgi:hypothetical protein
MNLFGQAHDGVFVVLVCETFSIELDNFSKLIAVKVDGLDLEPVDAG